MELLADIISYILRGIGIIIAGCLGVFAIVILFGDEILWNFQVTAKCEAFARDKVRIKLKNTKKKGMFMEIRQQLKPEFQNRQISAFLNGIAIATIDRDLNTATSAPINVPITIDKPRKGHVLILKIDDEEIVSGRLS